MFMQRIKLRNILSFGPGVQELELERLNVLIGPNGSGKSNLIEVIALLRAAPQDLSTPVVEGGGVGNWLWRGEPKASSAHVEVVVAKADNSLLLRHSLAFSENTHRFELTSEQIAKAEPISGQDEPGVYFELNASGPNFGRNKGLTQQSLLYKRSQSVLSQIRDPFHYPELTWLGDMYRSDSPVSRMDFRSKCGISTTTGRCASQ